jgi:hypothetical protein
MRSWPMRPAPRQDRGFVVLAAVAGLGILALMVGLMAADQTTSTRRTIEIIQARRLMDQATASAFEEACAWLETNHPLLVLFGDGTYPEEQALSDENQMEKVHAPIDPVLSRRAFAEQGIELSPVSAMSSPWKIFDETDSAGRRMGTAFGILELSVLVRLHDHALRAARVVTVRRYLTVRPTPGTRTTPLVIQPSNLVVLVKEAV